MNQEDFHLIQALTNLSEVVDRERSITPDCLDYRKLVETPHSILSSSSHASSSFQTFPSGPFPSPSVTSVPPSPSSFSVGTPYSLHSIPYAEETLSSPPSSFLPIPSAPFSAQQQARRRSTRRNKRKISLGEQEIQEFGLAMEGLGDDEQKSKKQRVAELPPVVYYTLDSLRPYFHKKLPDAASILGLSPTKLKQVPTIVFFYPFLPPCPFSRLFPLSA